MPFRTVDFGFYPFPLDFEVGDILVKSKPDLSDMVSRFHNDVDMVDGWVYANSSSRVFGLAKTHSISHQDADNEDHLKFHVWILSFFTGLRLTTEEAGFVDATPLKKSKLVDFVMSNSDYPKVVVLAEKYWIKNSEEVRQRERLVAAIHAFFFAQYPKAFEFEQLLYLYTALDACYAIAAHDQSLTRRIPHFKRTAWLCSLFGMDVPEWAVPQAHGDTGISPIRNDMIHEAIYAGKPLGFALHTDSNGRDLYIEIRGLICRFIVATIAGSDIEYVRSPIDTYNMIGLDL